MGVTFLSFFFFLILLFLFLFLINLTTTATATATPLVYLFIMGYFLLVKTFFIVLLDLWICNFIQIFLFITVYPFSRHSFYIYQEKLAQFGWCMIVQPFLYNGNTNLKLYGDELNPKEKGESAIILCNHQVITDFLSLFAYAYNHDSLGKVKIYVKYEAIYLPFVNFTLWMLGFIFLKRNWKLDSTTIRSHFERINKDNIPIWFCIYPEGTRFTKKKHENQLKFLQENNLPELKNLLHPKSKGMIAAIRGLSEHCTAIYDVTILYEDGKLPMFFPIMKGLEKNNIHFHMKRYDLKNINMMSDEELKQWLLDRFMEKDKLLEQGKKQNKFPMEPITSMEKNPEIKQSLYRAKFLWQLIIASVLSLIFIIIYF